MTTYLHDKILREAREQREADPRIVRPSWTRPLPKLASRALDRVGNVPPRP